MPENQKRRIKRNSKLQQQRGTKDAIYHFPADPTTPVNTIIPSPPPSSVYPNRAKEEQKAAVEPHLGAGHGVSGLPGKYIQTQA